MTTSVIYNPGSGGLERISHETDQPVYVTYPNSTDFPVTVVRYTPRISSMKISFAPGTNFDDKTKSKVAEKVKRSNYTFRPVSERRRNSLQFQAPASTVPSSKFISTTKEDFRDTTEHVLRSMKPQPKWFYRSQTDITGNLPSGQGSNLDKMNVSVDSSSAGSSGIDTRYSKSLTFFPQKKRNSSYSKMHFNSFDENDSLSKPLVGNENNRIIMKARLLRDAKECDVESRLLRGEMSGSVNTLNLRSSVRGNSRRNNFFTQSLQRYGIYGSDSDVVKVGPMKQRSLNTEKGSRKTSLQRVDSDMERTYNKQKHLKELLQK